MDTTAATMHPAEEYLRNEQNQPVLYVRIYGELLRKENASMATFFQIGTASKKSIIRHRKRKTKRIWTGK